MQQELEKFTEELKESLKEKLVSVALYGSATKGEHIPKKSDLNVLVILKQVSLNAISQNLKLIRRVRSKANINPVFWSEEEITGARDVFPVEFEDIKANHKIIYGTDPFGNLAITNRNLRHQLEFELRSKLLRLRSTWLELTGNRKKLETFLAHTGGSFLHLFKYAQKVSNSKLQDELAQPFYACQKLKHKEIAMNLQELETLYDKVHKTLIEIVGIVEVANE